MYGANKQFTPNEDIIPNLNQSGIGRVQGIVGALLYYERAVDKKILMELSAIGTQ